MVLSSCHREDVGAYRLSAESFAEAAYDLQNHQRSLAAELMGFSDERPMQAFGEKRDRGSLSYIRELALVTGKPGDSVLSFEARKRMEELRSLKGEQYRLRLIGMVREVDQELIGLHVRASTPQGVAEDALRAWIVSTLPKLTDNLEEPQSLK